MESDKAVLIEEYKMLRAEIINCINLQNNLCTFVITATSAILALALTSGHPVLFLLPLAIIIPLQGRIFHYRRNILKLSAYNIVFLEPQINDIMWETRHQEFSKRARGYEISLFRSYENFFLGMICYLLYIFHYSSLMPEAPGTRILLIFVPLIPVLYLGIMGALTNRAVETRSAYISLWRQVQKDENADNSAEGHA